MTDPDAWQVGTEAEVSWIKEGTPGGLEITSAIPPIFDAYATIALAGPNEWPVGAGIVVEHFASATAEQPWWLGYLDTGTDTVFPDVPRVRLYANWSYVLVLAGSPQARTWPIGNPWRQIPDLIFPVDRSWLISWLWDDDWICVGGPNNLIEPLVADSRLMARRVELGEDATPPGHVAY